MSKYGVISGPNAGKYEPEITPYLDTFHPVIFKGYLNVLQSSQVEASIQIS